MATVPGCPHEFPETDALGGTLVRIVGPPQSRWWMGEYTVPKKDAEAEATRESLKQDADARIDAGHAARMAELDAHFEAVLNTPAATKKRKQKATRRTSAQVQRARQREDERQQRLAAKVTPDWLKDGEDEAWQRILAAKPNA